MELAKRVLTSDEPYTFRGKPFHHRSVEIGHLEKCGHAFRVGYKLDFHVFLSEVADKIVYVVQDEIRASLGGLVDVKQYFIFCHFVISLTILNLRKGFHSIRRREIVTRERRTICSGIRRGVRPLKSRECVKSYVSAIPKYRGYRALFDLMRLLRRGFIHACSGIEGNANLSGNALLILRIVDSKEYGSATLRVHIGVR